MTIEEILALLESVLGNPNATPEEMAAALAQVQEALTALAAPDQAGAEPAINDATADQVLAAAEKITKLKAKLKKQNEVRAAFKQAAIDAATLRTPVNALPTGTKSGAGNGGTPVITMKSRFKSKHYKSNDDAFTVGQYLKARLGDQKAAQWYAENVGFKTLTEGDEASAGLLVPEAMEDSIWNIKEARGVVRRFARIVPMASPVSKRIKFVDGPSVFFVAEGTAPTASNVDYRILSMSAKKLAALVKATYELADDSIINIVDMITEETAYALADKEDRCAFIGDGTSTYGGIVGVRNRFQQILEAGGGTWTTDADKAKLASVIVNTGATWASVTDADIVKLRGKVRQVQAAGQQVYFTHSAFYYDVMLPLARGKGGVTASEAINGMPAERYDGFPVVFVEVMPSETAVSEIPLYFGDMSGAVDFGDMRQTTVETDKDITTQIWDVVTTERFDINVHDVGNYHATAASRKRGSLAALITKNS